MACYHIQYTGGGTTNCYYCDLCPMKKFDWDDPNVEHVCKNGEEYRKCEIWKKYSY